MSPMKHAEDRLPAIHCRQPACAGMPAFLLLRG
jgi:hypothetical protein